MLELCGSLTVGYDHFGCLKGVFNYFTIQKGSTRHVAAGIVIDK